MCHVKKIALALALVSFHFFLSLFSSCFLRICRSCWRWCASRSSTRPTCWTWWTTRSWLSPRRRVVIWSTKPSATTCSPTRDRRCRRPGLDRGSLPVSQALNQLNQAASLTKEVWIITALTSNWHALIFRTVWCSPPNLKCLKPQLKSRIGGPAWLNHLYTYLAF